MKKQTAISYWLLGLAIIFSICHNLFYGLTMIEEPLFFSLSILSFFAFLVSLGFSVYTHLTTGKPKDIWKLGWLGLLGLLGFLPRFSHGFYGLYGFFGFFGLKKE